MIKDILVNIPVGSSSMASVNFAISVASSFEAHLAGIGFAYEPVVPGTVFDGAAASIIATYAAESEKAGRAAIGRYDEAVRRAGVSAESHLLEAGIAGAGELFAQIARHYDLAVLAQAEPDMDAPEELLVEATLFGAGRPILIVPYIQKSGLALNRVLVCWDGGRSSARAVGDAMSFLERAKVVEVLTVAREEGARDELPGADLAHHLARHGRTVELKRIVAPDVDVANTILSHVADTSVDLIVMGGYGHSRLREFVLGGVTRQILAEMTVPVLMSH